MTPKLPLAKRQIANKATAIALANPAKKLKKTLSRALPAESPCSPPSTDIESLAPVGFSQAELDEAREKLLAWYDVNHRILPWRRNSASQRPVDGSELGGAPADLPQQQFIYFVWVSEVMSQQTQTAGSMQSMSHSVGSESKGIADSAGALAFHVSCGPSLNTAQVPRAAEYFQRWVAKWPTVADLAAATEGEVNEMWAGLGYYRRARFLLAGAHYIVGERGGTFPTTAVELKKIPGVGAYTGNAIASIACLEPVAVLDANVVRVVSRLRCLTGAPLSKPSVLMQTALADALLDPLRPGDFNQAVMELGATVCTVHQPPSCSGCPLRGVCHAYAAVLENPGGAAPVISYPAKTEKAKKREDTAAVAVIELLPSAGPSGSKFLLLQRPKDGLLAGLWEFPLKLVDADTSKAGCREQMEELLAGPLGLALTAEHIVERRALGDLTHIFTHIRLTMRVEHIKIKGPFEAVDRDADEEEGTAAVRWLSRAEIEAEGLSSGVRKVFDLASKASKVSKEGIQRFLGKAKR